MTDLILKLLKIADITNIEKQDLHLQLLSHSDYPSLKSVTDSLDYFGIENIAANVPKDALAQLPSSFLALINSNEQNSLVLVNQIDKRIKIIDESGKKKTFSIADFKEIWTGTIIAIEVSKKATLKSSLKISKEFSLVNIAILAIYGIMLTNGFDFLSLAYTSLSLIGVGISYLIAKESTGESNAIVAKVCGVITNEVRGCSAVINSKKGEISKNVSLGDISIMYFLTTTICSTILGVHLSTYLVVAILSLPIIIYTIYTQALVLKSWCFLCLGIAFVLLLQFVVLQTSFVKWDFSIQYIVSGLFITTIVTLGWLIIKPLLEATKELASVKKDFLSFKRDAVLFDTILQENEIKNLETLSLDSQIFFGDRNGALQLTAYTNPLCGYCTEAFEEYDKLVSQFPNDIGIQFVFNTPANNDNSSTLLSKRIIELYQDDSHKALQALRDWFATKDIDAWKSTYGESTSMLLTSNTILNEHRNVVAANEINYTPETLIANSKLSRKHYQYKDIALFINHFKEKREQEEIILVAEKTGV